MSVDEIVGLVCGIWFIVSICMLMIGVYMGVEAQKDKQKKEEKKKQEEEAKIKLETTIKTLEEKIKKLEKKGNEK